MTIAQCLPILVPDVHHPNPQTNFMKKFLLSATLLIFVFTVTAQNADKNSLARQVLIASGSGKLGIQVMNTMIQSYKQQNSSIPSEFWEAFMKEVSGDELVDLVAPIYTKYFTPEELTQLLAFYNSPIGQKVVEKTPYIMQESMGVGREWGLKISQKIVDKMKEQGYLKQ